MAEPVLRKGSTEPAVRDLLDGQRIRHGVERIDLAQICPAGDLARLPGLDHEVEVLQTRLDELDDLEIEIEGLERAAAQAFRGLSVSQ